MQNVQIDRADDGCIIYIPVNEVHFGVLVESITMYIGNGEEGSYDGDLAVNWSTEGLTNNENADTMGSLLLRNFHSDDDVTRVMGEFYWNHAFDARLREILLAHGFSVAAVNDVCGSEWGMQDEGRASYDASLIAEEARKYFLLLL